MAQPRIAHILVPHPATRADLIGLRIALRRYLYPGRERGSNRYVSARMRPFVRHPDRVLARPLSRPYVPFRPQRFPAVVAGLPAAPRRLTMAWNEPGNGQRDPWNKNKRGSGGGKPGIEAALKQLFHRLGRLGGPGGILTIVV